MSVIDTQSIRARVPMYRYHRIDTPITISHKYLGMWRAGVSSVVSVVTGRVLQAEASLVAFSHGLLSDGVQQVVMAELVHAVVVSVDQRNCITPQKKTKKQLRSDGNVQTPDRDRYYFWVLSCRTVFIVCFSSDEFPKTDKWSDRLDSSQQRSVSGRGLAQSTTIEWCGFCGT